LREELRAALRTVLAFSVGIAIGALARPEPSAVLPYAYLFLYLVVGAAGVYVGLSWRKLLGAGRRIAVRGLAFTASAIAGDIVAGLIIAVPLGLPLWLTVHGRHWLRGQPAQGGPNAGPLPAAEGDHRGGLSGNGRGHLNGHHPWRHNEVRWARGRP